eukprot:gb/GECH01013108.1/.p1 GENE.gb/GECH01013108.1/~~gb/GECH01013108.1/.p1  ORF type:complete len:702 (+),score=223.67 gb/GECH01013108.1/:1-2106(+)
MSSTNGETKETGEETNVEVKVEDNKNSTDRALSKTESIKLVLRLFPLAGEKVWLLVLVGTLFSMANGIVPLLFYLVLGDIIDAAAGTADQQREKFNESALQMFYIAIGAGAVNIISQFASLPATEIIKSNIRNRYMEALTRQEIGFFDANKTGGLISNLSEETTKFAEGFGEKFTQFWEFITQAIGGICFAFAYGWQMTLVVLATSPALFLSIAVQGGAFHYFQKKTTNTAELATNVAEESITGLKTVRAFAGEEKENERYTQTLRKTKNVSYYKGIVQGFTIGSIFFVVWGVCALAFWFGGRRVVDGAITMGNMMRVFGMVLMTSIGMAQAMNNLQFFSKGISAGFNLMKVLDRTPLIPYEGGKRLEKIQGRITLENIEFTYPTRAGKVLKGISEEINVGETIALVGSSGSGKSTIVSLVERFYDLDSGRILIDGEDIKDLDPLWLHQNIGIVTQEPALFSGTIEENIKYGAKDSTREQVISAAKSANAHDFISQQTDGYDTVIGERGVSLSGGQKQRIAIARALLKDPLILLLDEATSALDTESEHLVQEALDRLMVGRTTIVIAHRLSTVQDADRILVIEKGNLVEKGSHQELLQQEGVYAQLAARQMKYGSEQKDDKNDKNDVQDDENNNDKDDTTPEQGKEQESKTIEEKSDEENEKDENEKEENQANNEKKENQINEQEQAKEKEKEETDDENSE